MSTIDRLEILKEKLEKEEREIERLNKLVEGLREERDYLFNKTTTESNYEIERLNNIIEQTQKILYIKLMNESKEKIYIQEVIDIIENLKGSDKE